MKDKIFKAFCYCRLSNEPEKEDDKDKKLRIKSNQIIKELYYSYKGNNYIPKLNFDGKQKSCL